MTKANVDMDAVKAHATKEGREDYQARADDVTAGLQDSTWAWPYVGADEAYINAMGTDAICRDIGIDGYDWNEIAETWCEAFRAGYIAANDDVTNSGSTSPAHRDLKPRAVAVLVALRKGPRSAAALADALADVSLSDLRALLECMADGDIHGLIRAYNARTWGLTHDGLGWLQSNGLDATQDAKQALYAVTDAELAGGAR